MFRLLMNYLLLGVARRQIDTGKGVSAETARACRDACWCDLQRCPGFTMHHNGSCSWFQRVDDILPSTGDYSYLYDEKVSADVCEARPMNEEEARQLIWRQSESAEPSRPTAWSATTVQESTTTFREARTTEFTTVPESAMNTAAISNSTAPSKNSLTSTSISTSELDTSSGGNATIIAELSATSGDDNLMITTLSTVSSEVASDSEPMVNVSASITEKDTTTTPMSSSTITSEAASNSETTANVSTSTTAKDATATSTSSSSTTSEAASDSESMVTVLTSATDKDTTATSTSSSVTTSEADSESESIASISSTDKGTTATSTPLSTLKTTNTSELIAATTEAVTSTKESETTTKPSCNGSCLCDEKWLECPAMSYCEESDDHLCYATRSYCLGVAKKNYVDSQTACLEAGGQVTSIHSEQEVECIRGLFVGDPEKHWIGMVNRSNRKVEWSDGTSFSFDKFNGTIESFKIINAHVAASYSYNTSASKWDITFNPILKEEPLKYVCKKN